MFVTPAPLAALRSLVSSPTYSRTKLYLGQFYVTARRSEVRGQSIVDTASHKVRGVMCPNINPYCYILAVVN